MSLTRSAGGETRLGDERLNADAVVEVSRTGVRFRNGASYLFKDIHLIVDELSATDRLANLAEVAYWERTEKTKAPAASEPEAAASPTAKLEAEIIRILNRDFPNTKKPPTFSQFYQEHFINGRTMTGLARAKGWKVRTMHERKKVMKAHLTRTLGIPIDLDALRTAPRKSGKIFYTNPGVIERTYGDGTQRDED